MLYIDPAGHAISAEADALVIRCPFCQDHVATRDCDTPLR